MTLYPKWTLLMASCHVAMMAPAIQAAWNVTVLHPVSEQTSFGTGNDGTQQVGHTDNNLFEAALWSGSSASYVSLHPAGAVESWAHDVDGGRQVGTVRFGPPTLFGPTRAALWSGTAASWIDLTPAGATSAGAFGMRANQQAGSAAFPGPTGTSSHAGIWSGTATSWVDVHPNVAARSGLLDTDGVQQVGVWAGPGVGPQPNRAGLWSGSAGSFVDLHIAGALSSDAHGVDGGQQVGRVNVPITSFSFQNHASLWSGSAASWVDLHPSVAADSTANDVDQGVQVGTVRIGSGLSPHASLWTGSASSWVDLHQFLPAIYSHSFADGVEVVGNTICVVGTATTPSNVSHAVMWCQTIPEPGTAALIGAGLAVCLSSRPRRLGTFAEPS